MKRITVKKFILFLILFSLIIVFVYLIASGLYRVSGSYSNETDEWEKLIAEYLVEVQKNSFYRSPGSEFECASKIIWTDATTESNVGIVFTESFCGSYITVNGVKELESGGQEPPYYKLEFINGKWKVTDADNRYVNPAKEEMTKDWMIKSEKLRLKQI